MIHPGTRDLVAQRFTPFIHAIDFIGYDFTGATFKMEVRQYRDQAGAALISLIGASAGSEGISVSVATDDDGIPTSTVTIQIDEATLEAVLPYPDSGVKAGSDVALVWDIHITPSGGTKTRWLQGAFILAAGATQ